MNLKVKYHADITPLEQVEGSDWIDLRTAEDVKLEAGEFQLISLGVSIQLPPNCEAYVIPRSSTFKNWGLLQTNSFGLIDESYCGDNDVWCFPAMATEDVFIPKNTRIAQFRVNKKMGKVDFDTVLFLGNEDRGGVGSTGKE